MSKKITVGKLLGIIFCILAVAGTVVLLGVNIYLGGQMKLVDNLYTALERDDFDGFKDCFENEWLNVNLEEMFTDAKIGFTDLQDNKRNHAKANFARRQKYSSDVYILSYDLTIYNDDEIMKEGIISLPITRDHGKWVIAFS